MLQVGERSPPRHAPASPTCQTRGGGPRPLPRSTATPAPSDLGSKLQDRPYHPGRARPSREATPRRRRSEEAEAGTPGASSHTWWGVGRSTWGPLGGRSAGSASGLCLRSRQWSPAPRGPGRRGCGGCVPRPRPGSRQLTWAPRRRSRLQRSAPPAQLSPAPRGPDGRAGGEVGRSRRVRWSATPPRAARRLAAAAGNPSPEPAPPAPAAHAVGAPPLLGPAPGRAGWRQRAEAEVAARLKERGGGGGEGSAPRRAGRGRRPRTEAADLRAGERLAGAHDRRGLRFNFAPAHCAHLPGFSPRRPRYPRAGWFRCLAERGDCLQGGG